MADHITRPPELVAAADDAVETRGWTNDENDDDEAYYEQFNALRSEDGGHECWEIVIRARRLHQLRMSNAVRLDQLTQRGIDNVSHKQIQKPERIEAWARRLQSADDKPFLGTLIWNVRKDEGGVCDFVNGKLRIRGKIFMTDSYHRHSAIVKAVEGIETGGRFDPKTRFSIKVYNLPLEEERRLFTDLNNQRTAADSSRVKSLHPQGAGIVANLFIQQCPHLHDNIENMRNTLSKGNYRLCSFNTLEKAIDKQWPGAAGADRAEQENIATYLTAFWNALVAVRPELGKLGQTPRQRVRAELLVDSAGAIAAYIAIAYKLYPSLDFARLGMLAASETVTLHESNELLAKHLDFFSRALTWWQEIGLIVPSPTKANPTAMGLRNARDPHDAFRRIIMARIGLEKPTPPPAAVTDAAAPAL